jgi:nitroreductase
MDVIEAIRTRRSIRSYSTEPVPKGLIDEIIETGRAAPSAGNRQARDFFVVTDQRTKDRIAVAALGQDFIATAPYVIVVCANQERIANPYRTRGIELYCIQDASASVQNMLLTIHARGLATCWIGAFDEGAVSEIISLTGHLRPVAILPIGYPAEEGREPPKRSDDVHWLD